MIPPNNDPTMLLAMATGRTPQPRSANPLKAAAMRNVVSTGAAPTSISSTATPMPDVTPSFNPSASTPTSFDQFRDMAGLSFPLTATQGLSPKGKYGGFTTQDQLNQAVYGEAIGQRAGALNYAADVRDFATRRLEDINRAVLQAQRKYAPTLTSVAPGTPATRMDAEMVMKPNEIGGYTQEQLTAYQEAMRDYAEKAGATPRSQLGMVQDIQQTPLYQYARAVATGRYGMNPYQAIGEYGPELDVRAFEQQRELKSFMEEGMPYDAARQAAEDFYRQQERDYQAEERAGKVADEAVVGLIEGATGISQNRLRSLTGLSNDMIYSAIANQSAFTGSTPQQKFADFRNKANQKIADFVQGDEVTKQEIIQGLNAMMSEPSQTAIGQLQWAMLRQYLTQQGGGQKAVGEALFNQLSPIIDISGYQGP